MLMEVAFSDLRKYIKRRLAYARYRVGSAYYNTPISDIVITPEGIVRVKVQITPGGTITINQMALFNNEQQLWASQNMSITLETGQTHIMYWFDFNITEEEV